MFSGNPAEGVAPDVADVIAPGVPREVLIRQQRQIEDLIRHGGAGGHHRAHGWLPLGPMAGHGPIIGGAHHHGQVRADCCQWAIVIKTFLYSPGEMACWSKWNR